MWKCENCNADLSDAYDSCIRCGAKRGEPLHTAADKGRKPQNTSWNAETGCEEYNYISRFVKFNRICIIAMYVLVPIAYVVGGIAFEDGFVGLLFSACGIAAAISLTAIQAILKALMAITRHTYEMSKSIEWQLKHND